MQGWRCLFRHVAWPCIFFGGGLKCSAFGVPLLRAFGRFAIKRKSRPCFLGAALTL